MNVFSVRTAKMLLGAVLLALLLWFVDFRKLIDAFSNITLEAVVYLVFMSIALIYVSAFKWGMFLEELGGAVRIWRLFRLYVVGYFVNLVLPSYLGGDAVRSFYVGKSVGQHEALAATILERYTGLVAMIMLGIVASFIRASVPWPVRAAMLVVGASLVLATFAALSTGMTALIGKISLLRPAVKHLHKVQEGLHLARKNYRLLLKAVFFSFVYHLLTVINTAVAAVAVGWGDPSFLDLVVVLPLILIVSAVPISPNGLGIQEGAWVFFLQSAGATPAAAMGIALILRAKSYLIAIFGYLFWLGENRRMTMEQVSPEI